MKVAVFGLGYVGTVTAACLASRGHAVCGIDIDMSKVEMIAEGKSPVLEPGLDPLVKEAVANGFFSTSMNVADALEGAEVSLVCVGTPSSPNGGTDLRYVLRAVRTREPLRRAKTPSAGLHSIVIRSTVPPGTVDDGGQADS